MRLFIAVRFSEEIRRELLNASDSLRSQALSGNFTRPENLHLTLAFLGETNETGKIKRVLDAIRAEPFPLTVGGSGRFGDTWWVGVSKNPALTKLVDDLRKGLNEVGITVDSKPFKPHVTLARQIVHDGPIILDVPMTEMTVARVSLMKSERINGKLTYTEVYGRVL